MPVWFSPDGGAEAAIVAAINANMGWFKALVFMYQSGPIHDALVDYALTEQGVSIIFDRRQQFIAGPRIQELIEAGAVCYFDKHEKSVRSQYLFSEEGWYFTGSYLWTYTSEIRYAENLYFYNLIDDWQAYSDDWDFHQSHSELIVL